MQRHVSNEKARIVIFLTNMQILPGLVCMIWILSYPFVDPPLYNLLMVRALGSAVRATVCNHRFHGIVLDSEKRFFCPKRGLRRGLVICPLLKSMRNDLR